jgi:hypothetical protein
MAGRDFISVDRTTGTIDGKISNAAFAMKRQT